MQMCAMAEFARHAQNGLFSRKEETPGARESRKNF